MKSGNIKRSKSYIMAIPKELKVIDDLEGMFERLNRNKDFNIVRFNDNNDYPDLVVKYKGLEYEVEFYDEEFQMCDIYGINHKLSNEEFEIMKDAKVGITVGMTFNGDPLDSYHLQLKIIDCIIPEKVGLLDFNVERILSGKWASIAAKSKVPPSPSYLYSIQAISDNDKDGVWLHTHGLNRCGVVEFEILNSSKEAYQAHANVLDTLAKRVISDHEIVNEKEPYFLARLNNGFPIVGTWVNLEEALNNYPEDIIGGIHDREEGHNKDTVVFYIYTSQEDEDNKNYVHLSVLDDYLCENPIYMITTSETKRMKALAEERIFYFKSELNKDNVHGLMKFGLLVDHEYQNESGDSKEHIWFEVIDIKGSKIKAILTQDPYYISGLAANDEMLLDIKDMTDWLLYTSVGEITPDLVYLLE